MGVALLLGVFFVGMPWLLTHTYTTTPVLSSSTSTPTLEVDDDEGVAQQDKINSFVPTHREVPEAVRALYMTSWIAGTPHLREGIVKLIEDTEINAIVIDIKDDTGRISFDVYDPMLDEFGAEEIRIRDLREFIAELHEKEIYVIGRISTFQDPYFVTKRPDLAVKRSSDGGVWQDRKGLTWIDPGAKEAWDYLVAIGKESYRAGFDELNYDYIRFPSDGDMYDIYYPFSEDVVNDPRQGKTLVMEEFFEYLTGELRAYRPYPDLPGPVLSADLFGMTTTNADDLNIGQKLETALPYFDYIAPMVYPSHYPPTFIGLANPAANPYEVIKYSMDTAQYKIDSFVQSSSTPEWIKKKVSAGQLRPWIQDFNLGADYTADMVRAQIKAIYDSGLDSWMIWDASNTYTQGALIPYYKETQGAGSVEVDNEAN